MPHALARRLTRPALLLAALTLILALSGCGTAPAIERGAELRVRWVLPQAFPATIRLHRTVQGQPLWLMRSYPAGEAPEAGSDVGAEIAGGNMRVTLDEAQLVVAVLRNPLDRPARFWVAPHLPTPHSAEDALMIRCLCTGETYEVPALGTWTRVMELGIRRRDAVDTLIVTHVVTEGEAPAIEASRAHGGH
ncbi:MAG: hypothetical protein O2822_03760 [Chloroflexi bacterium]|nr:hypothetical protein [Chloroflexota bacterium]